jgi:hypothetical protein
VILAVDAGSARTKVALIAPVVDQSRLVGSSAAPTRDGSGGGAMASISEAVRDLERMSGWRLLKADGTIEERSVDRTVLANATGHEVPVAVLSGVESNLAPTVSRVSSIGNVKIVLAASIEGARGSKQPGVEQLATGLDGLEAVAIVMSAQSRRHAAVLAALIMAADIKSGANRLSVLYSGAADVAEMLKGSLQSDCDFRYVSPQDWAAVEFPVADLEAAIQTSAAGLNGQSDLYSAVARPSGGDGAATQRKLLRFLAKAAEASVCVVDVGGSTSSTMFAGTPQGGHRAGAPISDDRFVAMGTSRGLTEVLKTVDLKDIKQWLPFDIDDGVLRDYLANRARRPWLMAGDVRQLLVDQAVARVCGLASRKTEVRRDLLVATGAIGAYPRLGQTALALLDIAQPSGPCRMLIDRDSMLPRLAALAQEDPHAAALLLRDDTFVNAGVCLSLTGRAKQGETVAEIGVQRLDEAQPDVRPDEEVHEIRFGTLTVIPVRANEQASIRVATGRRYSFGIEQAGTAWSTGSAVERNGPVEGIVGGVLGLIIDARGRPIELASDRVQRQARLSDWLRSLDAFDAEVFSGLD